MLRDFSKDKFDIIIQAGQSNSQGSGIGDASEPFTPDSDILHMNNDFTISLAQEQVSGNNIVGNFSLAFAKEYIRKGFLKSGRKILILRAAVGGTGFADKRWGLSDDLFLTMMDMIGTALSLNSGNRLVALLWHQGETDAILNASYETHYKNLDSFIGTVRNTFSCENLPFIAGDFVNQWKEENHEVCEPVIRAIKDVCENIGSAVFVETAGLQSNDERLGNTDTIHFCREALNQMGIRYFEAFRKLLTKV